MRDTRNYYWCNNNNLTSLSVDQLLRHSDDPPKIRPPKFSSHKSVDLICNSYRYASKPPTTVDLHETTTTTSARSSGGGDTYYTTASSSTSRPSNQFRIVGDVYRTTITKQFPDVPRIPLQSLGTTNIKREYTSPCTATYRHGILNNTVSFDSNKSKSSSRQPQDIPYINSIPTTVVLTSTRAPSSTAPRLGETLLPTKRTRVLRNENGKSVQSAQTQRVPQRLATSPVSSLPHKVENRISDSSEWGVIDSLLVESASVSKLRKSYVRSRNREISEEFVHQRIESVLDEVVPPYTELKNRLPLGVLLRICDRHWYSSAHQ